MFLQGIFPFVCPSIRGGRLKIKKIEGGLGGREQRLEGGVGCLPIFFCFYNFAFRCIFSSNLAASAKMHCRLLVVASCVFVLVVVCRLLLLYFGSSYWLLVVWCCCWLLFVGVVSAIVVDLADVIASWVFLLFLEKMGP